MAHILKVVVDEEDSESERQTRVGGILEDWKKLPVPQMLNIADIMWYYSLTKAKAFGNLSCFGGIYFIYLNFLVWLEMLNAEEIKNMVFDEAQNAK